MPKVLAWTVKCWTLPVVEIVFIHLHRFFTTLLKGRTSFYVWSASKAATAYCSWSFVYQWIQPVKVLPWNLVWNGPETEPLRAAVSAPCSREMTVDLVQGQRKPHDSNWVLLERGHKRSEQKTAPGPSKTFRAMILKVGLKTHLATATDWSIRIEQGCNHVTATLLLSPTSWSRLTDFKMALSAFGLRAACTDSPDGFS